MSRSVKGMVAILADDEKKDQEAKEAARLEAERRAKDGTDKMQTYKAKLESDVIPPVHSLIDELESEFKVNSIACWASKDVKSIDVPHNAKQYAEEGGRRQKAQIARLRFLRKTGAAGPRWVHIGFMVESRADGTDGDVVAQTVTGAADDKAELPEFSRCPVATFTKSVAQTAVDQIIEHARSARLIHG